MVGPEWNWKIAYVLLGTFLVFCFLSGIRADAQAEALVSDYAQIFSSDEKSKIRELASEISQDTGFHVVVLTAADAHGSSSLEYLESFYEEQGFAGSGARGGIGFVMDLYNRELNLITEGDAVYYITDEREEAVYDAGYKYARNARYGECMYAMLRAAQQYFAAGIPDGQYVYDAETGRIVRHRSLKAGECILAAAVSFFAAFACCFAVYRRYGTIHEYEYSMDGNADFHLQSQADRLVNQFETARKIETPRPPQNGGGRTGPSGRSTVHRSSGGHSYGGGHGRKF